MNSEPPFAMDIFTHTLSGIAAASAVAAFSSRSLKEKFLMIGCGAAGAMLPDLDAITRWPDLDAVIGKALGLSRAGRSIYYGHHWYSHHNFLKNAVGGFGYIWWWNNYDIFLIFLVGGALNAVLIVANRFLKNRFLQSIPVLLFLCMICAALFQIGHRPTSFVSAGNPAVHAEKEHRSLVVQRDILGDRLYSMMTALDRKMPIPF